MKRIDRIPGKAAPESLQETLSGRLRAAGHRVTPQRLLIHQALRRLGRHVTADEVLKEVAGELPSVGEPTVYATLDLLVELGLARRIATHGGGSLYDLAERPHHHVECVRCRRVADLGAEIDLDSLLEAARASGYRGARVEVTVQATCPECAGEGRARPAPGSGQDRRTASRVL